MKTLENTINSYFATIDSTDQFKLSNFRELKNQLLNIYSRERKLKRILNFDIQYTRLENDKIKFVTDFYESSKIDPYNPHGGLCILNDNIIKYDTYQNVAVFSFNSLYPSTMILFKKCGIFNGMEFDMLEYLINNRKNMNCKKIKVGSSWGWRGDFDTLKLIINYHFSGCLPEQDRNRISGFSRELVKMLYERYKMTKIDSDKLLPSGKPRKKLSTGIVYADTDSLHIRYENEQELNRLITKIENDTHQIYNCDIEKYSAVQYHSLKKYIIFNDLNAVKFKGIQLR